MSVFEFFFGIAGIAVCAAVLPLPLCCYYLRARKIVYLYMEGLLLCYLAELFQLLFIFCFLTDKTYSDSAVIWIHFPFLRIVAGTLFLAFDFFILLEITEISFQKWMLLPLVAFSAVSSVVAMLPQSASVTWGFYFLRQLYRFVYCIFFILHFLLTEDHLVKLHMKRFAFSILGCFVLTILITIEDSMMLFQAVGHIKTPGVITERNFSETLLWIFISVNIFVYCIRQIRFSADSIPDPAASDDTVGEACPDVSAAISGVSPADAFAAYYQLTQRETEIVELLMENMENTEICSRLFISPGTLKAHLHNIYTKTDAKNRAKLTHIIAQFSYK